MDQVEKATMAFLTSLEMGEVKAFPIGQNEFPDFSIGNRIGVECTRLVHRVQKNGVWYILDELEPKIIHGLERVIDLIPSGCLEGSYFVCLDYGVEIDLRAAQKELRKYLERFSSSSRVLPHRHKLNDQLQIEILRASKVQDSTFLPGAINSRDGGGWVLDQLTTQTREAIDRKTRKLQEKRDLFEEWWLAVSGSVSLNVSDDYVEFVKGEVRGKEPWNRVLLIDSSAPERSRVLDVAHPLQS